MSTAIKILLIEQPDGNTTGFQAILKKAAFNYSFYMAGDAESTVAALTDFEPHVIVAEDGPAFTAIEALALLKTSVLNIPFIAVSTPGSKTATATIVNTIKNGAFDYILADEIENLPQSVISTLAQNSSKNHHKPNAVTQPLLQKQPVLNELQYRQIVESAQEGIWMIDEKLETIFVNKKMCDILGYRADEIMGKHNYDFKPENEKDASLKRIANREFGITETHESTFITKSGKRVLCIVATNNLFDVNNHYYGKLAMITDITQRKADEDALRVSEANLSAIIENTTDLVYSLDKDFRLITFNQLFKNTMKTVYNFDIAQGANILDLITNFDAGFAAKWKNIYLKAFNGEMQQFVNEYPVGPADKVYLSYSINPIWESGKVIGLSCFSRDISRQKMDEIALRKSEASLRTIFNNTEMACALINNDGIVVQFNNLAQKFTYEIQNIIVKEGDHITDLVAAHRRKNVLDILAQTKNGAPVNYQLSQHINNTVRWFDITWAGIKNSNNEDFGHILTIKEITENKKLELEREKITADLLQRNKALEQFTYIISHNLRSPAANILGLTSLIKQLDDDDPDIHQILTSISLSAGKLDNVISDLNQVLQINEGLNDNIEPILLPKLIDDIKYSIRNLIDKEDVNIQCYFSGGSQMHSIKGFIHSIFYNLILNSIKYRIPGTKPAIVITSSILDQKIRIIYKDNGRGIDTSKHAKELFGLYKRFDTSVEGKGMGLFMIKTQIESLGGSISVQSALMQGTEFTLEFPQVNVAQA